MTVLILSKSNFTTIQINNVTAITFVNNAYVINGVSYPKDDYDISILW